MQPVYPNTPTQFELATAAGLSTAMVAGKSKFAALARPGALRWQSVPTTPVVRTEDTFGTLCVLLGLTPPATTVARLVTQILEDDTVRHPLNRLFPSTPPSATWTWVRMSEPEGAPHVV